MDSIVDKVPQKTLRRRTFEIVEIAEKNDISSRIFDVFLIILIITNVVAIVLESVKSINAVYGYWFDLIEIVAVAIFSIEYLVRIWVCVENEEYRFYSVSNFSRRLKYMRSGNALIDLLAILPFYLIIVFGGVLDLRFLRALRLLRVFKLTRYSQTMTLLFQVIHDNARAFIASIAILLIVMLIAASGIYMFEHEVQPVAFGSVPAAMWWAFATLTTVGYGDVTPITTGGRVFGAAITVVSVGMVALPAGILASAFSAQLAERQKIYEELVRKLTEDDGIIDDEEAIELEETRKTLGISELTASKIMMDEYQAVLRSKMQESCPHCGKSI
ncbi:MAG: ion transporter [Methylococcales bacterium]|jgi:voltage-gated potassium channel|nr:ion transporter [Methylococcales bacterium]